MMRKFSFMAAGTLVAALLVGAATSAQAARSDFDGDGPNDIPWMSGTSVVLLKGQTATPPTWPQATGIASATAPKWAETGDFDEDQNEDIGWYADGALGVFWGDGAGGFTWQANVITGLTDPSWAGVGDFTDDGKMDLAWLSGGAIDVYVGKGAARSFTFNDNVVGSAPTPTWAGTGDFSGDGPEDIAWISGGTIKLLTGGGLGATGSALLTDRGTSASDVTTPEWAGSGDFDGDENDDIATIHGGVITLYRGKGNTSWTRVDPAVTGIPKPVWGGTGDFNQPAVGASRDDIALYLEDGSMTVLRGKTSGFDRYDNTATSLPRPVWAGSGGFAGHVGYGFYQAPPPPPPPKTPPSAPQNVSALSGDTEASVTWSAPASDGGSPITGYTVTVSPGGATANVTGLFAAFEGLTNGTQYTFTITAKNAIGTGPGASATATPVAPPPPPPPPAGYVEYVPMVPSRLIDTRPGTKTGDGQLVGGGLRAAGSTTEIVVGGRYNIPADALAATLNVTVTDGQPNGYLTVWPCGAPRPEASSLNYGRAPLTTVANLVVSKLGDGGKICVYASAGTHLIADVSGYFPTGSKIVSSVPARVLDTRNGTKTADGQGQGGGQRLAEGLTELQLAGRVGVPSTASAVMLNVTAVGATADGFLTVWPCGSVKPTASNVNFAPGDTIPNAVISRLPANGKVCIFNSSPLDLVVDVVGHLPFEATYRTLVPGRLLDTRPAKTVDNQFVGGGRRPTGSTLELPIAGRHGIPATATTATLNVTAVVAATGTNGYVTVWPCGATMPTASNLNFVAGQTIANAVVVKLGTDGKVCLFTETETDLIVDASGYYAAT